MDEIDVQSVYELGLRLLELGELDEVEERLRTALLTCPDDGRLIQLQGLVWHARRRYAAATRAFELATTLVPLSLAAQLAMADSYRRGGRADDARTILNYLAERPDMPTVLLPNLTAGLGMVGEYQAALDVCRQASQREPDCSEPIYGMAYYMNKLHYPPEVILPLLRRSLEMAPDCKTYRVSLAVMCGRAGHWDEAYELFVEIDPGKVGCQTCIGFMVHVYERVGDHVRRDACLCRLLELSQAAVARGGAKAGCRCSTDAADVSAPAREEQS